MEKSKRTRLVNLSDLPDSILIDILSKLPIKDAAITTFLSREWHFLWRSITRLEFDESDQFPGKRRRFLKFVDTVMNSREQEGSPSSLVSFSLRCNVHFAASRINGWIVKAVSCKNLQELSLSLGEMYYHQYILPNCISMCETLRKLTLDITTILKVPGNSAFCIDKINYLKLRGVEFADDESAEKLISCPLLEELILESCNWNNIKNVKVSAQRLQLLTIDDSEGKSIGGDRTVTIVADHLKWFYQKGNFINEYKIKSSIHLYEAQIMGDGCSRSVGPYVAVKRACKLFKGLSGVKNITIGNELIWGFDHIHERIDTELFDSLPVFYWMTVFKFRGDPCTSLLYRVLQKSPHLEILEIQSLNKLVMELMLKEKPLPPLPSCFRTHLKRITIFIFHSSEGEIFILGVLLSIAAVLEEMVLHYFGDHHPSTVGFLNDNLNMMPRASRYYRISVVLRTS